MAHHPTPTGAAVTTVVRHEWPEPASLPPLYDNRLAQPYGGYISRVHHRRTRIFVRPVDLRARQNGPYRAIQFAVNPFKPWVRPGSGALTPDAAEWCRADTQPARSQLLHKGRIVAYCLPRHHATHE